MTTACVSVIKTKQLKRKLNNQKEREPVRNVDDWRSKAACKDMPKNMFFPENCHAEKGYAVPRKICGTCPVKEQCLATAMKHESGERCRYGMFGGLTPKERYLLDTSLDRQPRRVVAPITTPIKELPHWLGK
jgi:hypothetical protein